MNKKQDKIGILYKTSVNIHITSKKWSWVAYLHEKNNLGGGKTDKSEKKKTKTNTPGTPGGPGGRDRTLAVKSRKNVRKITFFSLKNLIYPQKIFSFAYIF